MLDEEGGAGGLDEDFTDAENGFRAGAKEGVEGDIPVVGVPEVGGRGEILEVGHGEENFSDGGFTMAFDENPGH